ncbi:hypothetical protein QZM95_20115 [Burkholderia multivorans]|nr:hypothetical protein [Burkholderia multivorans]MDN7884828.1 hypothetical protein [Burkholderia multivorans]MDN7974618.1 hypothetical protein [Burkholderia multivorans]MDN7981221.1 hypothetical protein [Burkholderia multivorans]MDN7986184.1 hypothetical protein [Burkholderia multivorans]
MNEQPKNQQPAAAPIDECELCHSSGYMDETLGGALPGVPDAPCMNGCKATEQTAPSPADERAAFEDAFRAAHEFPEHADQLTFRKGWESAIMWQRRARAASANETGAEVAQWQSRLKGRSSPVVDHWVNISPDGAKTLMEKYADVYEVRALYTAPRSPAVAAEPVAWAVYNGWSRICFYMTEDDARDHAKKAQKNHDLSGSLAAFRVVPLYAAPQPAQADAPVRTEALRKGLFEARDAMRVMSNWVKEIDPAGYSWGIHMVHRANAVLNGGADTAQADAPAEAREPHSDDVAVDSFAAAMKHKLALARAKGRGGWETCSPADLSRMLREHVEKGDPRDVANFCMMLWHHGSPIVSAPADARVAQADAREGLTDEQREAIEYAITRMDLNVSNRDAYTAAKELRALLNGADHAE